MHNDTTFPIVAPEKVLPYLHDQLSRGEHVARGFLACAKLIEGQTVSTLPSNFPGVAFEDLIAGETMGPETVSRNETLSRLAHLILGFLTEKSEGVYIAEAAILRPSQNLSGLRSKWLHDGENVYLYAESDSTKAQLVELLDTSEASFRTLGFVTHTDGDRLPPSGSECPSDYLHSLGCRSIACVVGAYDQEAHLVWQRIDD